MYRYIRAAALPSTHVRLIRKLEQACVQYADSEYGFGFVGGTPTAEGWLVSLYTSPAAAAKKDQDELMSRLYVGIDGLDEEDLKDPDYMENSAYSIIEDMCNDNSGEIERGPAF